MNSMTGYGLGKAHSQNVQIQVAVRSVNGRFLEARYHLPKEYNVFEFNLKKTFQQIFKRGSFDIYVSRKFKSSAGSKKVTVNLELAKQYLKNYKDLGRAIKITEKPKLSEVARFPEIFSIEEIEEIDSSEEALLQKAHEEACLACLKEREREGLALKKDLEGLLQKLSKEVSQIELVRAEVNKGLQEKWEQKLRTRIGDQPLDPHRISQEIAIYLEKIDINEEIIRLGEHIRSYSDLFKQDQPGKKLDFYTQELLREVNTIGSKSNLFQLTQSVVESKAVIERLREQVQNIE